MLKLDDDYFIYRIMKWVDKKWGKAGFKVDAASNAREAIELDEGSGTDSESAIEKGEGKAGGKKKKKSKLGFRDRKVSD